MQPLLKLLTVLLMLAWALLWVFQVPFMLAESALVLVALLPMFLWPECGAGLRRRVATLGARLARRKRLAVVVIGMLPMLIRVALLPLIPIPDPVAHDEFSYLLAADTFAKGRLANPTHPLWVHFETPHVNHEPAYVSKFPPAQGLFMAAGQAVLGHPWFGVWLSVGLMCAAVCWALQGWFRPEWALFGGILLAIRIGISSYWMNSYWGGAVAALGGALLVGAIPRLRSRPSVAAGILSGLGLAILANSRPFEGLVLALPLLVGVLLMAVRMPAGKRNKLVLHAGLAAGITVAVCGFAMAYYKTVGAGDPLRMPYQVNRDEYGVAPYFVFQSPSPEPLYRHKELRDFYAVAEMGFYQDTQSAKQMLIHRLRQTLRLWNFYGGAAFSIALLTLPATLRDRRIRLLVLTLGVFLLCISFEVWVMPHYVAPALAAFWILLIQTLRHLWVWRENGKRTGRFFVAAVPVVLVLTVVCCLSEDPLLGKSSGLFPHMARCCSTLDDTSMHDRARIEHALKADGGRHLIVVHYSERHNVDQEWVYNRANIDQEQVVWAREMSSPENENLLRYFEGRKVWLLDADAESPAVVPYPGAGTN